jgi:hypothetical protein
MFAKEMMPYVDEVAHGKTSTLYSVAIHPLGLEKVNKKARINRTSRGGLTSRIVSCPLAAAYPDGADRRRSANFDAAALIV